MKTVAMIPTRFVPETLEPLVDALLAQKECDEVWLYDNTEHADLFNLQWGNTKPPHLFVLPNKRSLYGMWNDAWRYALTLWDKEEINLFLLNDDIIIPDPTFLAPMVEWLRSGSDTAAVCPDYNRRVAQGTKLQMKARPVHGSFKDGGLCGWAFGFKAEWHRTHGLPLIDERFQIWCGDDALFREIENRDGELLMIEGLPVDHWGGFSVAQVPGLEEAKGEDIELMNLEYGGWYKK